MTAVVRDTLGVFFLIELFVSGLFGVITVQAYLYFSHSHKDKLPLRSAILLLCVLHAFNFALTTYRVYVLAIVNFGSLEPLLPPKFGVVSVWSLATWWSAAILANLIVRVIFTLRVWHLSKRNKLLVSTLGASVLFALAVDVVFPIDTVRVVKSAEANPAAYLRQNPRRPWVVGMFATLMFADYLLSGSLCFFQWKNRREIPRTATIPELLLLYVVNTGTFTSIVATAGMILYLAKPRSYYYVMSIAVIPQLFFNALLGHLNSRPGINKSFWGVATETDAQFGRASAAIDRRLRAHVPSASIRFAVTKSTDGEEAPESSSSMQTKV